MQLGTTGGRLVDNIDEATQASLELLQDAGLRSSLGQGGRERVRHYFLSTRNLRDYLALFTALREDRPELVPQGIGH